MPEKRKGVEEVIIQSENVPIRAENFDDAVSSPREAIRNKLKTCDCYIGIFDTKWGHVPADNNPYKLSVQSLAMRRPERPRAESPRL